MACIKKTTVFCVIFLAFYAVFSKVEAYDQCTFDSDCTSSFQKYCCDRKFPEDNVCRSNCIFESCYSDSDCAPGECCDTDDKCTTGDCSIKIDGLAGWIVAVIVISVIVVIVIPIAVAVFCCCCAAAAASGRSARGGVVVTQPATTGVAVISSQQQQQYPAQQGQPMYYPPHPSQAHPSQAYPPQAYPSQPPPYQPYPTGASGPEIAMTPQTQVKQ